MVHFTLNMTTIDNIHKEIVDLKKDISYIKKIIAEDYDLSASAKKSLIEARKTPVSEYVDLE